MGRLLRKSFTKSLPKGAEIVTKQGKRLAVWRDAAGKKRTGELVGEDRVRIASPVWVMRYRDADGRIVECSTGCRDKGAAQAVLSEKNTEAERVRAGILSVADMDRAKAGSFSIETHFQAFEQHLRARFVGARHIKDTLSRLRRLASDCTFKTLRDLERGKFENWLIKRESKGAGARARNGFREALLNFSGWCLREGMLASNPFAGVKKANTRIDRRHERRALDVIELALLFDAAARRPLEDAGVNRGSKAELSPATIDKLVWLGKTRAMFWRVLAFTGLRCGELRSITLAQVHLEDPQPYIELHAADEKARRGAQIPLQADLAVRLSQYVAERLERLVGYSGTSSNVITWRSDIEGAPLFDVPAKMSGIFSLDLKAAGIPKRDSAGRVLDCHCLRHSFATLLARAGISERVAMRAMRHTSSAMTGIYTHIERADIHAAVESLPVVASEARAAMAANSLPPLLPPTRGISCQKPASSGTVGAFDGADNVRRPTRISSNNDAGLRDVALIGTAEGMVGARGFEPPASWSRKVSRDSLPL